MRFAGGIDEFVNIRTGIAGSDGGHGDPSIGPTYVFAYAVNARAVCVATLAALPAWLRARRSHNPPMPNPHRIYRKLAVLTEGSQDMYRNKTAMGLLRFRPENVVCMIDSQLAGGDLARIAGVGQGIPIVADSNEAKRLGAEWLVIGVATPGGYLPDALRAQVYDAIRHRIGIISGLHESVNGDPNLVSLSSRFAVELVNLRKVPDDGEQGVSTGRARETRAFRVLTVGTDANLGKTTTALALDRYFHDQLREQQKATKKAEITKRKTVEPVKCRFVATGQDGILISGHGVCIDRVISDFAGGMVEELVLEADRHGADLLMIEGQNAILSPCFSGTALSLLHGACPDAMILCHAPTRTHFRHTSVPLVGLSENIRLHEALLAPLHPGKVVAIALNTLEMDEPTAAAALAAAQAETGLPVADVVREGDAGRARLAAALLAAMRRRPAVAAPKKTPTKKKASVATKSAGLTSAVVKARKSR